MCVCVCVCVGVVSLIYLEIVSRRLKTSKVYQRDRKGMKLKKLKTQHLYPYLLFILRSSLPYCIPTRTNVLLFTANPWHFDIGEKNSLTVATLIVLPWGIVCSESIYSLVRCNNIILLNLEHFFSPSLTGLKYVVWNSANGISANK